MSKKLLLADDSITIQKVIQITFAHEDYELTITDNGDAALAKAQEIKPDLVMTDIYMPGKNGYELTAAIKQDPALQHVPVLLLAGSFEPFDEDKARSCKADAWIEKPFESQSLIDKVAELLSAAPVAPEAPALVAEPEAFVEEQPMAAFDEPLTAEPEAEMVSEDPFGDISFEEETPLAEPEPVAAVDDWSDVAAEPMPVAAVDDWSDVAAEPMPVAEIDDWSNVDVEPAAEAAFGLATAPVADMAEDFSFADGVVSEEQSIVADAFAPLEVQPVPEVDLDAFEMGEDDIMPLDDDDILGAEDLEPIMPEQTLAAWSRTETAEEDVFAEPVEEFSAFESEPVVEPLAVGPDFEEETIPFEVEPAAEAVPVFEEPLEETVAEPVFEEDLLAPAEAPVASTVAAAPLDVEARAAAMSEEDLEKIIEKVVSRVVEKLAGSILERVAWDVVPDLAENLIREEIRKIKDAAA